MTVDTVIKNPLHGALYSVSLGLKVFPCKAGAKTPQSEGWQHWAEGSDEVRVENVGRANPLSNWGVYCGASNIMVIDIDNKDGRDGYRTMEALVSEHGKMPNTFRVRTVSKDGAHIYFKLPDGVEVQSVNDALGPGVDIKSRGGYVMAAGSRIGDKSYEIIDDSEIAKVPDWILKKATEKKKEVVDLAAIPVVQPGNRNNILTKFAGTLRRVGMEADAMLPALLVENDKRCVPPLPRHEVETLVRSVCRYKPEEASAFAAFSEAEAIGGLDLEKNCLWSKDIDHHKNTPLQWVMQDRFLRGYVSVVGSPGGVGKSTLSIIDALSVAHNQPIMGFAVSMQGKVWVHNNEDSLDVLRQRHAAVCVQYKLDHTTVNNLVFTTGESCKIVLVKGTRDGLVVNTEAVEKVIQFIRGHGILLWVLDPLVEMHDVNENDNGAMNAVLAVLRDIARATNCAISVQHHTRKSAQGGRTMPGDQDDLRGAGATAAAARICYSLRTMTEQEARQLDIPEEQRRFYVRFDQSKANFQAPATRAQWIKRVGIATPIGEVVGSLEPVDLVEHQEIAEEAANNTDRADMFQALEELFDGAPELSVPQVRRLIATSPTWAHLFGNVRCDARRDERVILLTNMGVSFGGIRYVYQYRANSSPKHYIIREVIQGWDELAGLLE